MGEQSIRDRLIEELEKIESYQRLYPDTYIDRLVEAGVTIRRIGEWVDGCCSVCGAYMPTDHRRDFISEEEVHFCYYCGSQNIQGADYENLG